MAVYKYDGCCGSCKWMNTNDYVGHKDHCRCDYRGQYYNLTERINGCRYYEYDPNKDYYTLNHRWYIVSAIFKKMGISDLEYECIDVLNNYRVNVLEKDTKYDDILREYDIVGPAIADLIMQDDDCVEICKMICSSSLIEILELIRDNKYDEALNKYMQLVDSLRKHYKDELYEHFKNNTKTKVK